MGAVFRFIKSIKLAILLIILLAALSAASTFIPIAGFFSSPFFLAPLALFVVNLSVCAADRIVRRVRARSPGRFGPDIVHAGLLLLIAGGLLSVFGRSEALFTLAAGDSARISPAYTISLASFTVEKYADGSPREWISTIEVTHNGTVEAPKRPIRVNAPLRMTGIRLYQAAYTARGSAALRDAKGELHTLAIGDGFGYGGREWYFVEVDPGEGGQRAVFKEGAGAAARMVAGIGGTIGPLTVESVRGECLTVLKAVRDPGAVPALCACGIILVGLCVSFIQRRRDG